MKKIQQELGLELAKKLKSFFGEQARENLSINLKKDNTFVTEIDLFVSNALKEQLKNHSQYGRYSFFSEEEFEKLEFPAAILDPIDGTRELIKGQAECAVSLGLMRSPKLSDPENFGWIYNPFSGFSLDSATPFAASFNKSSQRILGMVSRTEFERGRFARHVNAHSQIDLVPRGSIAFKLGLLASGGCDFVLSFSAKNIWDIAAGTILCAQRGMKLYQNGKEVTELSEAHLKGVLLWAPDAIAPLVLREFATEK